MANEEEQDRQLQLAKNKLASLFGRMQTLYDSISRISEDVLSIENFLADCYTVDTLRKDFIDTIELRNSLSDENFQYSSLSSFEQLYTRVKYKQEQCYKKLCRDQEVNHERKHVTYRKLPKLELVSFDGSLETWPIFYEIFRTAIHECAEIPTADKVQYLMSKLTGKALNCVQGILPTAENYSIIWGTLLLKYEDKRAQASAYIDKLMKLPSATDNSPAKLEAFIDHFSTTVAALKQLKIPLEDFLLIHIGSAKVGFDVMCEFEKSLDSTNSRLPSIDEFTRFIREHSRILNRTTQMHVATGASRKTASITKDIRPKSVSNSHPHPHPASNNVKTFVNVPNSENCPCCGKSEHVQLYLCPEFIGLSPRKRFDFVKSKNSCVRCLSLIHGSKSCRSESKCKSCSKKTHHTLLHFDSVKNDEEKPEPLAIKDKPESEVVGLITRSSNSSFEMNTSGGDISTVLLGTAQVNVLDGRGNIVVLRAIVDSASQRDVITSECCKLLDLKILPPEQKTISGVGDVTNPIEGVTNLTIRSRLDDSLRFNIRPIVVNKITNELPTAKIDTSKLNYLMSLPLADTTYNTPQAVDLILGADLFARILRTKTISHGVNVPIAIETLLGYLIVGKAPVTNTAEEPVKTYFTLGDSFETRMTKFLDLEEVSVTCKGVFTPEDQDCETNYNDTTRRDADGRYIVSLPFKRDPTDLGDSLRSAERQFLSLERKLHSNPQIKNDYDNVIKEHIDKGYIRSLCTARDLSARQQGYIIPHHAVIRTDKSTSKLRIVMNASQPTSNGLSLNDMLHTGPNLQNDLFRILLTFRLFRVAVSADIRQMYLRILVNEPDIRYQRILYRFSQSEPIQVYEITRVPFGMCCSPYLAIRTVRQLASDERSRFPEAATVAERDIYMDDLATSCSNAKEGIDLSKQLISLFASGGFELVKFSSNCPELMECIPPTHRVMDAVEFGPESYLKILGLHWLPSEDVFTFRTSEPSAACTKRGILSTIARLWDLMGFIAPVTLLAKLIIKSLWEGNVGWDDIPPQNIVSLWRQLKSELPLLETIRLPRHVGVETECVVTLIGCADASERAYGGVVYLHVYFPAKTCSVINLICAKSKVAPSKTVITLARMELCANLILARLMRSVIDTYSLRCTINNTYAFTDSTVALAWIHSSPARWQTFVANRVSKIQQLIPAERFHHIAGNKNPADCLSRGLTPAQLLEHPLWFSGPEFARGPIDEWPVESFDTNVATDLPERKVTTLVTTESNPPNKPLFYELAARISSWPKLLRIVVYILRFLKKLPRSFEVSHLDKAEVIILRDLQRVHFQREIDMAQSNKTLPPAFLKLNAFINDGILRVGGRLSNADLNYNAQHPILLPRNDHIVNLLIDYYHRKNLHTGPALLMSLLRQKFWILSARNIVRTRVQKCNLCFKNKPKNEFPVMADLPACRVQEAKPFSHTGVDYAGPLAIIPYRRRGVHSIKAYICLFICLVTKAVHIELATDLSTNAFLNALKRFLSRRGPVKVIYSDCGTNFVGAKTILDSYHQLVNSKEYKDKIANELCENRIDWKFNPASAPHFGGIWEGNIRCIKSHLCKVVGNQLLTTEEMQTVLTQIEAVLNSRPLTVLSSDPSEPQALTPAHFLTLTPLKSFPCEDLTNSTLNLVSRKLMIDQIVQSFWKRWKTEYLNTLQTRVKWMKPTNSNRLEVGTLVLLKTENSAPLNWPLGIIESLYPGKDGVTRVVDVRTKTGVYRRPVVKICPLPKQ